MKRVVIDTGVVLSAAFRNRKPEALVMYVASNKDYEWVVTDKILKEYNEVLARKKFKLSEEMLEMWRKVFDQFTTLITTNQTINFDRDTKDAIFLECAAAANAEYLVTGDTDFEDAKPLIETNIISVSRFMEKLLDDE